MNKKLIKLSFAFVTVISLLSITLSANNNALIEMGNKSVSENDRFTQAKLELSGEGLLSLVDAQLLEKDYGYDTNKDVKNEVDKEIANLEKNNPRVLDNYPGVESIKDLLIKYGSVLDIQRNIYAKDTYIKKFVTTKSLRNLYDNKAGEVTSYFIIRIDEADFEDIETYTNAIIDVEQQLAKANSENVLTIFEELKKTYPGNDNDPNGERTGVAREEVDQQMLKILDGFKYLEFNKKALNDDISSYFILKMDDGKRLSFEESKDRLTQLQFDKAIEENQYLQMYLLNILRENNDIKFKSKSDQKIYDLTIKEIIRGYNAAKDGGN